MQKKMFFALGLLAAIGCDKKAAPATVLENVTPADNSKQNERDFDHPTLTPGDQRDNDVDRGITQKIRQDVVKMDSLSTNAKNVKIITIDSVVTLRGPVDSEQEWTDIGAIAAVIAGVKRVDNQLEIAAR